MGPRNFTSSAGRLIVCAYLSLIIHPQDIPEYNSREDNNGGYEQGFSAFHHVEIKANDMPAQLFEFKEKKSGRYDIPVLFVSGWPTFNLEVQHKNPSVLYPPSVF